MFVTFVWGITRGWKLNESHSVPHLIWIVGIRVNHQKCVRGCAAFSVVLKKKKKKIHLCQTMTSWILTVLHIFTWVGGQDSDYGAFMYTTLLQSLQYYVLLNAWLVKQYSLKQYLRSQKLIFLWRVPLSCQVSDFQNHLERPHCSTWYKW